MSKKILSVVLALVFVLSTFAVSAFAINGSRGEDEGATYTQTWALENDGDTDGDGVWTVYVKLTTDYKVGAMQFVVNNPNENVKLTSAVLGDGVPVDYNAELTANLDTGKIVIVPEPADGIPAEELSNAIVAVLTYSVPTGESTTLTIDASEAKTEATPAGTLVALRMESGYLESGDMIYGQVVTEDADGNAAKTILGNASADLAKKSDAEAGILIDTAHTFGDTYKGVVYGFTQAANNTFMTTPYLTNNLEATNDGSLEFSRSIGKTGYGTGTVITVKNADGTEAAKYVVVIFGDVDGNGLVNGNDVGNVAAVVANTGTVTFANNSVQRMAANCQIHNVAAIMHTVNANDTGAIALHVSGTKVDQAALATKMASLTAYYI